MEFIDITENKKDEYNAVVNHPMQSYEWGEFRKKTGVTIVRRGLISNGKIIDGFTLTMHKVPKTKFTIGYLPKSKLPTKELLEELKKVGKENNCIHILLEPNVVKKSGINLPNELKPSFHPLFTKFTFILDITNPEDELLKNFHHKTRYNIKIAMKRKVKVIEDDSDVAFKEYLKLTHETTTRQKFYAHTASYHTKMWETLRSNGKQQMANDELTAHLLKAVYKPGGENKEVTLVTWILFVFHDTLYYPYGASSSEYRNVMASNLMMWEAIRFGKKLGLHKFDMWGALGTNPNTNDPWYGFHKFKEGYGAVHTEFIGSYDLVINPLMYRLYKVADKARWVYLKVKKGTLT